MTRRDDVRVIVPATPGYVGVLRLVTDAVAARAGFDVDRIEDLELAVDEAAGAIMEAPGVAEVHLAIVHDETELRCVLSADRPLPDGAPLLDTLRTAVLDAVTDDFEVDRHGVHLSLWSSRTVGS
jgi:anti-sigma regulatory factor (Ser/Thr protein kinase)